MTLKMKKKFSLMLDDEFLNYCEINNIDNVESLAKKIFQRGFTIEKYGETPTIIKNLKEPPSILQVIQNEEIEKLKIENIDLKNKLEKTLALQQSKKDNVHNNLYGE